MVEVGRLAVDDDESRAISFCHQRKSRRGPHHKRGPDGEEKVAAERQFFGTLHRGNGHCLAERYCRRLDVTTAVRTVRRFFLRLKPFADPRQLVSSAAAEA